MTENTLMTLDEAIEHCKEKEDCSACGMEHRQLRRWLEDYQFLCTLGDGIDRIKTLLRYEYECASRQSGDNRCDRKCLDCNLVQNDEELLAMYRKVISILDHIEKSYVSNCNARFNKQE